MLLKMVNLLILTLEICRNTLVLGVLFVGSRSDDRAGFFLFFVLNSGTMWHFIFGDLYFWSILLIFSCWPVLFGLKTKMNKNTHLIHNM